MEINNILSATGISLPDAINGLSKIIEFLPKAKGYVPMAANLNTLYDAKPDEKIILSLVPVYPKYTGNETAEEKAKLDALCEVKIAVLKMKRNAAGETVISDECASWKLFEEIEKITSLFPAMPKQP